jgi:hypothetical protein
MEPSNAPELYAVAQFVVPRIAADALDLTRIVRDARDAGMVAPNIEMNTRHAGANKIRVTCRTLMRYVSWPNGSESPRVRHRPTTAPDCATAFGKRIPQPAWPVVARGARETCRWAKVDSLARASVCSVRGAQA